MKITWSEEAWEDYLYWQETDKRMVKKINELIKISCRTPFEGIGKPEPLKHNPLASGLAESPLSIAWSMPSQKKRSS